MFLLWVNQFLIFGPMLCLHAQYVIEKKADPFTPCLCDLPEAQDCSDLPNDNHDDQETNNIQSTGKVHELEKQNLNSNFA